jgi:uncharacterized membrane protein
MVYSILNENGDLIVSEDITFDFRDKFNGVYRDIVLKNTDGIENLKLFQLEGEDEIPYTLVDSAKKGEKNVFTVTEYNDTLELMIFSPSKNEEKTFRINYTIKNVAIKHKDTGELYYKFIGEENDTPIDYFSAIIDLPGVDKEKTKIFAHGPLNGTIDFLEDNLIELEVSNVPADTFIEGRILFPLDFIGASENIGNSSFENIMNKELAFIKSIEKKAESRAKNKAIFGNISLIVSALGVAIAAFIFNKFRRNIDNSADFSLDDITPAELRLFFCQVQDSRSLMTTIFDLARRGFLTIEEITTSQKNSKRKKKDFLFTKTIGSDFDLSSHEKYFFDWIFNDIGNRQQVSTKDIEDYRKSSYNKFYKELTAWNNKVKSDVKSREYYDDSGKKWGWIVLFLGIASFIIGLITLTFESFYGIIPLLLSILLFIYAMMLFSRKSNKGYIQQEIWEDFKKDFSKDLNISRDYNINIPTDKTLIYALALGLPMKSIDRFRDNFQESYSPTYWAYWYFISNNHGGSSFEDRFNSSFYPGSATTTSSSVGSGGGFSGGGGGGAGGGGAGGF